MRICVHCNHKQATCVWRPHDSLQEWAPLRDSVWVLGLQLRASGLQVLLFPAPPCQPPPPQMFVCHILTCLTPLEEKRFS